MSRTSNARGGGWNEREPFGGGGGEEQATAATITGRGATRRLAQWSAGTRREFSRKLSRRWDDNGNPIEAVHLRRVMGLFGILIGKLQLTGPPVLSFNRGRVSNTTRLGSAVSFSFFFYFFQFVVKKIFGLDF